MNDVEYKLNSFLFSELVLQYLLSNDEEIKDEIYRRLKFCNFSDEIIEKIIGFEILIIKKRKLSFPNHLCDSFLWINHRVEYIKDENFLLFPLSPEDYALLDTDYISDNALTISEIIDYYDEARYMLNHAKELKIPKNMLAEAKKWGYEKDKKISLLKQIFVARFDLIYKMFYGTLPDRYFLTFAARFMQNELHILTKYKWEYNFGIDALIDGCDFEPYTAEYFNFYETN